MRNHRLASCQQHYVRAREITGDILCLSAPLSPTRRAYRTILEISPINFLLKAEEEQAAILDRYSALLKALTFPVQILIRTQPLDLRPYLAQIQAHIVARETEDAGPDPDDAVLWPELAADLQAFLKRLGNRRTLLTRHCYLVIPAPEAVDSARRGMYWRRAARRARMEVTRMRMLQDLAVRVETLESQLQALGLLSRRLYGAELARFYRCCLTPLRALATPLREEHLQVVGRLPRVTQPDAPTVMLHRRANNPPSSLLLNEDTTGATDAMTSVPVQPEIDAEQADAEPSLSLPRRVRRRRERSARLVGKKRRSAPVFPPPDVVHLADLLAPDSIQEYRDAVRIGGGILGTNEQREEWVCGIAITAFPREVSTTGWLAPLLLHDDVLDVVFHLHPQDSTRVLRRLKNRRSGYASTKAFNRRYGRLDEPEMEVAQVDVQRMMSKLASGEERLFEVSLLVLVRAGDRQTLSERSERVFALLQTILLDAVAHFTTFEHGPALRTALPECHDELARTITLDTRSLATTFPFLSNSLLMPEGTFLGITSSGEPVLLHPWHPGLDNPHCFIGGVSGAGKSTTGKLLIERSLLREGTGGEQQWVIDPEGEYVDLARAMCGCPVMLAPGSSQRLNPFDLLPPGYELQSYLEAVKHLDRLAEKIQDLRRLLGIMLAEKGKGLSPRECALLDSALYETYRRVGISSDPRTHYHQPPLLRDLWEVLKSGVCGPDECDLVLRLSPYIEGSVSWLFQGPTTIDLTSHLLAWNIREMGEDYLPIGIFLIADCIWTQAIYHPIPRALYIDEAATLMERVEGAAFLADVSRRARKRYLRLVIMTQNPERFVQDPHGAVIAANASTKILKHQDSTSVHAVATCFGLTQGETERLAAMSKPEALILCGDRRVLLTSPISPRELMLMTTNPAERAALAVSRGPDAREVYR